LLYVYRAQEVVSEVLVVQTELEAKKAEEVLRHEGQRRNVGSGRIMEVVSDAKAFNVDKVESEKSFKAPVVVLEGIELYVLLTVMFVFPGAVSLVLGLLGVLVVVSLGQRLWWASRLQ